MKRLAVVLGVLILLSAPAAGETRVDTDKSGVYTSGRWHYDYEITLKGSRSERRRGELTFDEKPIAGAAERDRIKTPWGVMQYFGEAADRGWGNSGWLLKQTYDQPIDEKKGRMLPDPEEWARRVAERTKALKDDVRNFCLSLRYLGGQDKPFYNLTLTVPPVSVRDGSGFDPWVTITEEEAVKIIDHLAESGFLGHAHDLNGLPAAGEPPPPPMPSYELTVTGGMLKFPPAKRQLQLNLGWNREMLPELYGLRRVLSGDAAKTMDLLMGRLSGLIKEWTGTEYRPPIK